MNWVNAGDTVIQQCDCKFTDPKLRLPCCSFWQMSCEIATCERKLRLLGSVFACRGLKRTHKILVAVIQRRHKSRLVQKLWKGSLTSWKRMTIKKGITNFSDLLRTRGDLHNGPEFLSEGMRGQSHEGYWGFGDIEGMHGKCIPIEVHERSSTNTWSVIRPSAVYRPMWSSINQSC